MTDDTTRTLSRQKAKVLPAGAEHYMAYVGPPRQYDFMGATQFRLLTTLGLRETHKLLDFGCGSLRAGRLLIPYLMPGNYHGLEPNRWLVEDGIANEIGQDLIRIKSPVFRHDENFSIAGFGVRFDFIVAQSIFSHTGRDLIATALGSFRKHLAEDGLILATFIPESPDAPEFTGTGWIYPQVVTYRPETILAIISAAGLVGRPLPWFHPRQTWFALAASDRQLPPSAKDVHLSGAVLRDRELAASS